MDKLQERAKQMLDSQQEIDNFAKINRLSYEAATLLLEQLAINPKASDDVNAYIFSNKTSEQLKDYVAGEEKGRETGYAEGFSKGILIGSLGILGAITLAGLAYLLSKKD